MAKNMELPEGFDMEALIAKIKKEIEEDHEKESRARARKLSEDERKQEEWLNEKVPYELPFDGINYKDDVSASVNGRNVALMRGQQVMIPRKYKIVLEQSKAQDLKATLYSLKLQREFRDESKARGL